MPFDLHFPCLLPFQQIFQSAISVVIGIQHDITNLISFQPQLVIQSDLLKFFDRGVVIKFIAVVSLHGIICISCSLYNVFVMKIVEVFSGESGKGTHLFDCLILIHGQHLPP